MSTEPESGPTSRMTIAVYRVGRDGAHTTVRETQAVKPVTEQPATNAWPACGCPQHRKTS
jgi:hypothetical protein